jgi:hypothetical protein
VKRTRLFRFSICLRPRRATEPEMPARMRAGLRRGVAILKGPGGGRPQGLPEPHVVANYSLMEEAKKQRKAKCLSR